MIEELKPCPFCGSKASRSTEKATMLRSPLRVSCSDDGCGAHYGAWHPKEWNTRAELAALKAGQGEPILVEAVAVTRENEDGALYIDWLLEGGIDALEFAGVTLIVAHGDITSETGSGEVYTAPPASADAVSVHKEFRSVIAMILNVLDRDAAEGRAVRGEMAKELRALLAQSQEVKS